MSRIAPPASATASSASIASDSVGMLPSGGAGPPPPPTTVGVALAGTAVVVRVGVDVAVGPEGVFVTVGVDDGVSVGPPGVMVGVGVEVTVGVLVRVGVADGVRVGPPGVIVGVGVAVAVGVFVRVGVGVKVGVGVGVKVGPPGVLVSVGVGVGVGVDVGVGVTPPAIVKHCENSEVLFPGFVAVAVANWRGFATGNASGPNVTFPLASVVTWAVPTGTSPSPKPVGSQRLLTKNSSVNRVLGVLFSTPEKETIPAAKLAAVRTGKF